MPRERETSGPSPPGLGRLETVGAWLRIWTPPKGVPVPPVPGRKLLLVALAAAAVLVPAGILAAGAIDTGKRVGDAQRRRQEAARRVVEVRRLAADQRPHSATATASTRGLAPAAARAALVRDLERAITADARARARRRLLEGPVRRTLCEHANIGSEARLGAVLARYRCTVVTAENRSVRGFSLLTGYVFLGTIRFRDGTLTWCKTNPRPGEQARGHAVSVKLSASCAGPLRDLY